MKENYNLKRQLSENEFYRVIEDVRSLNEMVPEANEDCYNDPFNRKQHANDVERISRMVRIRTCDLFHRIAPGVKINPFDLHLDTETGTLYARGNEDTETLIELYGFEKNEEMV